MIRQPFSRVSTRLEEEESVYIPPVNIVNPPKIESKRFPVPIHSCIQILNFKYIFTTYYISIKYIHTSLSIYIKNSHLHLYILFSKY